VKKKFLFVFFLIIFPFHSAFSLFQPVAGIDDSYIKDVIVSSFDARYIYSASKNSLYRSKDYGKTFRQTFSFIDEEIKRIFFDPYLANTIYVATSRNFYRISQQKERLFTCPDEEIILTAAKDSGVFYLGTNKGFYVAYEDILKWSKISQSDELLIYYIEPAKEITYLATSRGVYVFNKEDSKLRRVFITRESQEDDPNILIPAIVKSDIFDKRKIWLGTSQGLFYSEDSGKVWRKLSLQGIDNLSIISMSQTNLEKDTIYLGTLDGFFKVNYTNKDSQEIFEGLYASRINQITFSSKGKVYLATAKGLFENNYFTASNGKSKLDEILDRMPPIEEVLEKAMRYNEVHPEKIRKWRNALKYRALFPDVRLDYDKTINYDSGSDKYYTGPNDWGVSFSWDVGDLLWNYYEDDVDTRSRLNTQLRIDILEQTVRIYYEIVRLYNEIENLSSDDEEFFKTQLRLRELISLLDSYTGGYFSNYLEGLNEKE